MVAVCRIVEWDHANPFPAGLPRMTPTETIRVENDLSDDADCQLSGITITDSVWSIAPDDDDGAMTLSSPAIAGLVTSTSVALGTDLATYRLVNTVTLSDGQTIERTSAIPVISTRAPGS